MGMLLHPERAENDREVSDLAMHDAGATTSRTTPAYESTALDRGDRWGTVLAFMIVGTLAIAAILALWATFPADVGL